MKVETRSLGFQVMQLYVNSKSLVFGGGSLAALLQEQGVFERKGVAVALNQEVIARTEWTEIQLETNDQILIIEPTQGG